MLRRLLIIAAVAAAVGVGVAPEAAAVGCGRGFQLMAVSDVLRTVSAPGAAGAVRAGDLNGDGYLCVRVVSTAGGAVRIDPALVFLDN